jgi:homoserine dehydrogenase
MADTTIKIGLVGFGTVGAGVAKIILEDADYIESRTGVRLELATVVDLDTTTKRPVELPDGMLTDDIDTLLKDDSIDIGIELVGGTTFAKDLQLNILNSGKHVVTANKALLAKHGKELYAAAEKNDRCVAFEASCAGGIPIVSALRTGLAANRINAMYGILNGTCNYILSNMTATGLDFPVALKQAQEKGYAEADPTLDINGGDSAHKLVILGELAFGCEVTLDDIYTEGIENISIGDINSAREMGYTLKLLGIAERTGDKVSFRVNPAFVADDNPIARVDGPFNAISTFGHAVGQTMYFGRGAGMMPTASAIVADIIEVAMGNSQNLFKNINVRPAAEMGLTIDSIDNLVSRFYIRLMVLDTPGTFAAIGKCLADHQISISGLLQHEAHSENNLVSATVTTHENTQSSITAALADIAKLDAVQAEPVCIRIVDFPENDLAD